MMRIARSGALVGVLLLLSCVPAGAQLFGTDTLDTRFCQQPNYRQTVVYIDDMILIDGRTEWATKLSDKLRATLAPGERVTVVQLSPGDGSSRELWSGCWPSYSEAETARLRTERSWLSRHPLDVLSDQQKYFLQGFGGALTRLYNAGKRPAAQVRFTASDAPAKQLVRALASDEGRFASSKLTIRAIVYSDLAENSDLGSVVGGNTGAADRIGQRLGTYLRRSVFYAFGVGEDVSGMPGFGEAARGFWSGALRSMAATVGGMGSDLNVPNFLPVRGVSFPVDLTLDDQRLEGRLSLLVNDQGDLVDSWIGITRLGSAALSGTYRCRDASPQPTCRLDATTSTGITTKEPSESLVLSGTERAGLKGQLGVKGTKAMFELVTQGVAE